LERMTLKEGKTRILLSWRDCLTEKGCSETKKLQGTRSEGVDSDDQCIKRNNGRKSYKAIPKGFPAQEQVPISPTFQGTKKETDLDAEKDKRLFIRKDTRVKSVLRREAGGVKKLGGSLLSLSDLSQRPEEEGEQKTQKKIAKWRRETAERGVEEEYKIAVGRGNRPIKICKKTTTSERSTICAKRF